MLAKEKRLLLLLNKSIVSYQKGGEVVNALKNLVMMNKQAQGKK